MHANKSDALGLAAGPQPSLAEAEMVVDVAAVVANYRLLQSLSPQGECAAVVKGDAYGHGMLACAPALQQAGARTFFVASLADGVRLAARINPPSIAVLGGIMPGEEAVFVAHSLVPVLNDAGQLAMWSAHAAKLARKLPAMIHIDTGMNRLGLTATDLKRIRATPDRLKALTVSTVMSHLVASDDLDFALCASQLAAFRVHAKLFPNAKLSVANSAASFFGPEYLCDMHRPGKSLYGINPLTGCDNPMRTPATVMAPLSQVKTIKRGDAVGYSATWRATATTKVATVAIGYANGYPRQASSRSYVAFAGHRAPVIGRVSMDLLTIDVSAVPEHLLRPGTPVEILGPTISPAELAAAAHTNEHDVLIAFGRGCARRHHSSNEGIAAYSAP